jgi:hypothetical protein
MLPAAANLDKTDSIKENRRDAGLPAFDRARKSRTHSSAGERVARISTVYAAFDCDLPFPIRLEKYKVALHFYTTASMTASGRHATIK